jgi:geranylgeranyl transferase type-2 subunit beta
MRQAIQVGKVYLPTDTTDRVVAYFRELQNEDGGYRGRSKRSDLYYTTFAVETLAALGAEVPVKEFRRYLQNCYEPRLLDLVHLACLLRCWTILPRRYWDQQLFEEIFIQLEISRCGDGGYRIAKDGKYSIVYGCFMALGAYQDLGREVPDAEGLVRFVHSRLTSDGGYGNEPSMKVGTVPATAAALTILRQFGEPVETKSIQWLLSCCKKDGGFGATTAAPIPDLLSTGTAAFALAEYGEDLAEIREPCLDFVDSLWYGRGGFAGSWLDEVTDCEYTFYGLLAAGSFAKNMNDE